MLLPSLLLFVIFILEIDTVCFVPKTSSLPLKVIDYQKAITEPECRLKCLQNIDCSGISYSPLSTKCLVHGPILTGACALPFEYFARVNTGCTKLDVTSGYILNNCFTYAQLQPEYVVSDGFPICPGLPVEGEPSGRLWVLSVIFPNGTYRAFANDRVLEMMWDDVRGSFVIRFIRSGVTFIDEPVYAATCAYFADDASNTCPCIALPIESTAAAAYTDVLPYQVAPLPVCPSGYTARGLSLKNLKTSEYTPPMFITCRAGLWIQHATPTSAQFNSWEMAAGACYR